MEGRVFQASAPGVSLRLGSDWAGWTLGLHEMLVFFAIDAEGNTDPDPVAILTRAYGVDLRPGSISVGFNRRFAISFPKKQSVIQMISYSEVQPKMTFISRKEFQ